MTKITKGKREVRTTPRQPIVRLMHLRETEGKESRTIEGVAIVFNDTYEVTDSWGDTFREHVAPSAVTQEWLKTQDVKLNLLHERNSPIARCNKGEGNLNLEVMEDGLHFSFDAPECDLGDRALALVRAGVYSGCSFEFYPKDYDVKETKDADGNDVTDVTHTAFESLDALTIAMDPAYEETSVSARELREKLHPEQKPAPKKREEPKKSDFGDDMERRERMIAMNSNLIYS